MSIMWKYLDKRSATIAAIKDYDAMQFIIKSTDDEIKHVYDKMGSVGSPKMDGMPRTRNPNAIAISNQTTPRHVCLDTSAYFLDMSLTWNELSCP